MTQPSDEQPLVLVENEATYGGEYDHWEDRTGVTYHFPNQYRNRVVPGRPFVYYRGVRRAGGVRGQAEYFGLGRIGNIWRDSSVPETAPRRQWRWYCDIEDYIPFPQPVLSKWRDGYLEDVQTQLGWRTGVRLLPVAAFQRIILLSGIQLAQTSFAQSRPPLPFPPIEAVSPTLHPSHGAAFSLRSDRPLAADSVQATGYFRRSRESKLIGDRAEEIVFRWLAATLPAESKKSLRWVSREGETPGWDIEYLEATGEKIGVEVKGATSALFGTVELTGHEWSAAHALGKRYRLVLVTRCLSTSPGIAELWNPVEVVGQGGLVAEAIVWRLSMTASLDLTKKRANEAR